MRKIEWIKDERGEVYIPRLGTKIYANHGVVLASVALNSTAYNKLMKQVKDEQVGEAII